MAARRLVLAAVAYALGTAAQTTPEVTLPSPADIEKLICEVASQKQVEDRAVAEICQVITEKFPNIKFNPDCKTDVEAVWDAAVAKCPQAQLTLPSPADIEKLICEVASQKSSPTSSSTPTARRTSRPSGTRRWPSARRRS
ncbi:unnamed protein product [Prorocentrum cordatum]|uniref:Uncharacterized protein n=1 Tax=Prorocentrum cordatum TaxID=2364126 RepID=A0ABN9W0A6_9DINO|nr:unnamed protein product [Polarella glacialis]